jgi:D-glycero-D-manno-heptose 1,7-bisphosphate phosphatase
MSGQSAEKRLVILDRDGVINKDSSAFVKSVDEWVPLDGSILAIAALPKAGLNVAVASNLPAAALLAE